MSKLDNTIIITGQAEKMQRLPMRGTDSEGNLYEVDNISLLKNGKRFLPVMGELHYSRYEADAWEEELRKVKAGGIDIVATYVFWIHHEERKDEWDFEGCRDLRRFLAICGRLGLQVWLRIGPWAHGECRNGGFPDWLVKECADRMRSNDPVYLEAVKRFYHQIGKQVQGMMVKDGGPILGIQLENEYGHCGGGPASKKEQFEHMRTLKKIALEEGMEVPYYTSTGWGGGIVLDGETLPVLGGYVDAPWAGHIHEMPASKSFLFSPYKQDHNIGSDLRRKDDTKITYSVEDNPYFTAELGGGLQVTAHRRVFVWPEDTEAQALCMLGSGANLLGYYMYHGGINPDGKESTLQESRATGYGNDLPLKSYDFQACIRQSGEINESYGRLKKLHLLLQDFGESIAGSTVNFPQKRPDTPEDMDTLRVSARICEDGSGFLFVNNHQRKRQMKERVDAAVKLIWPDRELVVDKLNIRSGSCAVIPFGLELKDEKGRTAAVLDTTNASLLCRIGARHFFYTDAEPIYRWRGETGNIVTLTTEQANCAYKIQGALYLTEHPDSILIEKDGEIYLISSREKEKITVYLEEGEPVVYEVCVSEEICRAKVTANEIGSSSEMDPVTEESGLEHPSMRMKYREYLLRIEDADLDSINQLYLDSDYLGDRAEVYLDGKLVDDWFSTGERWHMALKRFGYPKELKLRIYASDSPMKNPYDNQVYYDLSVEKGCELRSVKAIPEYLVRVNSQF